MLFRSARLVAIWDRVPPLAETVAMIDAVDRRKVRDFAGGLASANAAMALYGPVQDAPTLADLKARLVA